MASNEDDFPSMLTGGVITIYVGSKRKEYQVHKGLLASCEYWRKYLDSNLLEDSQTIHLPQEHPDVWDLFVNWLYRGSLKVIPVDRREMDDITVKNYVCLWTQAHDWDIRALEDKIFADLCRFICVREWFPCDAVRHIYENTSKGSRLRSFATDSFLVISVPWNDEARARLKAQLDYGNQEFVLECFHEVMEIY